MPDLPLNLESNTRFDTETLIKILAMVSLEQSLTSFEIFYDFETRTMTLKGFKDDQWHKPNSNPVTINDTYR